MKNREYYKGMLEYRVYTKDGSVEVFCWPKHSNRFFLGSFKSVLDLNIWLDMEHIAFERVHWNKSFVWNKRKRA